MKKMLAFLCIVMLSAFYSCGIVNNEPGISKSDAADQLLQFIYSDNEEIISTFSFSNTDQLWGYEGYRREYSEESYQTMVLEFVKDSDNQESYIFMFHERHYYNGELDHDVTSNFYAVSRATGQIVPERIYSADGTYELNNKYKD